MTTAFERAVIALKSGDKTTAKQILASILQENPRDENAWLCTSIVVESSIQQHYCLEKVLEINPNNKTAQKELLSLHQSASKTKDTSLCVAKSEMQVDQPFNESLEVEQVSFELPLSNKKQQTISTMPTHSSQLQDGVTTDIDTSHQNSKIKSILLGFLPWAIVTLLCALVVAIEQSIYMQAFISVAFVFCAGVFYLAFTSNRHNLIPPTAKELPPEPTLKESPVEIRCPKCGSTQIVANSSGFGVGKAAVGTLLLGPVGLLGGFIGSKKMKVICISCGCQWQPGRN